ncbi:zinc finger BED domain-containing protein RICESLEEPER 2-like [Camellia sinensis]|uniref:zinc finger BED domain-containing protein RICESLEEPER 2-like n=1 Tax=Camellia sinensis TaxID=4442 RepID=UPI001036B1BA|nr:zinc finger BED domain-containing protein RICESLEEPER 2-like [Camellia sinensis]
MAMKMKLKFEKYCNIEKINPLLIVAVVLDPRYKLKYVKFSFTRYYSISDVDAMIEKVKLIMKQLYDHYSSFVLESMENVGVSKGGNDVRMDDLGVSSVGVDMHKQDWHQFLKAEETVVIKSEFDRYLEDGVEEESEHFDILAW